MVGNWTDLYGVALDFSRPCKPTDNAFVEAFSERFRHECLKEKWCWQPAKMGHRERREIMDWMEVS